MSLPARVRTRLQQLAASRSTISYQALANEMTLAPPNTIQQLTNVLESLMREDARAQRPLLAALVISKRPPYLPQTGFFELAQALERFDGHAEERAQYHAREVARVYEEFGDGALRG